APKSAARLGAKSGTLKGRKRPSLPLVLLIVGGLVLLGAGATLAYYFGFKGDKSTKNTTAQGVGDARRLVLTKNPNGAPLHFTSLAKAVAEFKPGDTIVIADDTWEEYATASRTKNLVITGDGKTV